MTDNIYEGDAKWYDIEDLDSDEEVSGSPPLENLLSAASFVTSILKEAGIVCAVLGGLGIILNGIERETWDVDIGISSEKGWRPVRQALDSHLGRLKLPKTRLVADNLRMFCRTGAPWDNCRNLAEVEVDLLSKPEISKYGTPSFWISNDTAIPVFTPIALFRFKLIAYSRREALRDLHDMDALVRKVTPEKILEVKDDVICNLGEDEAYAVGRIPSDYRELATILQKLFGLSRFPNDSE